MGRAEEVKKEQAAAIRRLELELADAHLSAHLQRAWDTKVNMADSASFSSGSSRTQGDLLRERSRQAAREVREREAATRKLARRRQAEFTQQLTEQQQAAAERAAEQEARENAALQRLREARDRERAMRDTLRDKRQEHADEVLQRIQAREQAAVQRAKARAAQESTRAASALAEHEERTERLDRRAAQERESYMERLERWEQVRARPRGRAAGRAQGAAGARLRSGACAARTQRATNSRVRARVPALSLRRLLLLLTPAVPFACRSVAPSGPQRHEANAGRVSTLRAERERAVRQRAADAAEARSAAHSQWRANVDGEAEDAMRNYEVRASRSTAVRAARRRAEREQLAQAAKADRERVARQLHQLESEQRERRRRAEAQYLATIRRAEVRPRAGAACRGLRSACAAARGARRAHRTPPHSVRRVPCAATSARARPARAGHQGAEARRRARARRVHAQAVHVQVGARARARADGARLVGGEAGRGEPPRAPALGRHAPADAGRQVGAVDVWAHRRPHDK